ncbi:TPA: hypothetical protein ACQFDA_004655 [Escherichia coli]
MKLLIDFSLSSSRDRLNKILTEMRSKVRLELHDAIAVYERKLTKENNGETVVILDAKAMVDFLVDALERRIHAVIERPYLVRVTDPDTTVESILEKAFVDAAHYLQRHSPDDFETIYVGVIQQQNAETNIVDTVCWSDILTNETISRVRDIFIENLALVKRVCSSEIIYLSSKYEKPKGV